MPNRDNGKTENELNETLSTASLEPPKKHPAGRNAPGGPPGNKKAVKHGYHSLVATLNKGHLDRRTLIGRFQMEKERELATALGGDPSPQETVLIADTVKTLLYLGCLDTYLIGLKSAVRKGRVHPVLTERFRLAGHIRENLKVLGLQRRIKSASIVDLLSQHDDDKPEESANAN